MANIMLKEPDGSYGVEINTGLWRAFITEAFIGVTFVTSDGEVLDVCMRDGGFEVVYSVGKESQFVRLVAGDVTTRSN